MYLIIGIYEQNTTEDKIDQEFSELIDPFDCAILHLIGPEINPKMQVISTRVSPKQPKWVESPQNQHFFTLSDNEVEEVFDNSRIQNQDQEYKEDEIPSIPLRLFFIYLYFTQGVVLGVAGTMPYIYPKLPSYDVMAVFSAVFLPYSFKFFVAPFVEKYSVVSYGKRKFWILIAQTLASLSVFAASFFTAFEQAYTIAILLFMCNFFMILQDISLDSLAKKQLKIPYIISNIGAISQSTGSILGSMLLLKLTSAQFAAYFEVAHPLMDIRTVFVIFSIIMILPTIFIHFFFHETILHSEFESVQLSICKIITSYRAFFIPRGKFFRCIFLFLIMKQGFNFFTAGYDYELVKAGFSREVNNTIENITSIPVAVIICAVSSRIKPFGLKRGLVLGQSVTLVIFLYMRVFFPLNVPTIATVTFLFQLQTGISFMITSILYYQFPIHGLSGMFITFFASMSNFGGNPTLHTKILALSSWWLFSYIGLAIQLLIILCLPSIMDWVSRGTMDLEDLLEKDCFETDDSSEPSSEYPSRRYGHHS